ncbi:Mu transposase C-terminal domain-containing protein [Oceaniglobus trochenteri]|uniref:Mu transposase C-terminal domain-containing protein n=1 Tax=Oceaniglobus trochenteri TaxID=2763260 RepID=UPI001CFFBAC2|nr:Mu transposase C-terminal domain-containing protein [Oceaniglobus trochenteri]
MADLAKSQRLDCFPQTESAAIRWIKREGWRDLPSSQCRKRSGRGGGYKFHRDLFPEGLRDALGDVAIRASAATDLATAEETGRGVVKKPSVMSLDARQRVTMEARSSILLALRGYQVVHGETMAGAVRAFVQAQKEHGAFEAAVEKRDQGEPLTAQEAILLTRETRLLAPPPAGFGLSLGIMSQANNRPNGGHKIGRSTLYGWIKAEKTGGVVHLAPSKTKQEDPLPDGFREFLAYYARPTKPCVTEALEDYNQAAEPAHRLTLRQVRHTLRVKLNDIERNVGREGLLTLRSRMAFIRRDTDNLLPTTIYTADGKTFDAEVADWKTLLPVKPEITSIIDVATRKCVGFALSRKENTVAVTEALRKASTDFGIPAIFYTDRGAGYKNKTFDADVNGLMGRLSITKMHALPYNSQAKGIVERFNKTVWNKLARSLPSYLGEGMDKEAKQAFHKSTRADIKEFGASHRLMSWEEFYDLCAQAVTAYNAAPHRGLPRFQDPETGRMRHLSPDEAWAQHVADGFEPVGVDEGTGDDLFRPYEFRVAKRAEVQWNNNTYFHPALEAYHGERVMVGYDHADADRVWVREVDMKRGQPGPLICVATFGGNRRAYVAVSAQKAAEDRRMKGRLARLGKKARDVEAEQSTAHQINHSPTVPLDPVGPGHAPEVVDLHVVNDRAGPTAPRRSRRQTFATDEDLAEWALAHPDEVKPRQAELLRECLRSDSARTVFRMSGIDVEALRALLRTIAA